MGAEGTTGQGMVLGMVNRGVGTACQEGEVGWEGTVVVEDKEGTHHHHLVPGSPPLLAGLLLGSTRKTVV